MKNTLKKVVAALETRAEAEWQKLQKLENDWGTETNNLDKVCIQIDIESQRARWAAWDAASEIAKGKGITSFETEQRSV